VRVDTMKATLESLVRDGGVVAPSVIATPAGALGVTQIIRASLGSVRIGRLWPDGECAENRTAPASEEPEIVVHACSRTR
jgi:hypothetical protein